MAAKTLWKTSPRSPPSIEAIREEPPVQYIVGDSFFKMRNLDIKDVWKQIHAAAVKEGRWHEFSKGTDILNESYPDPDHRCIVIDADHN